MDPNAWRSRMVTLPFVSRTGWSSFLVLTCHSNLSELTRQSSPWFRFSNSSRLVRLCCSAKGARWDQFCRVSFSISPPSFTVPRCFTHAPAAFFSDFLCRPVCYHLFMPSLWRFHIHFLGCLDRLQSFIGIIWHLMDVRHTPWLHLYSGHRISHRLFVSVHLSSHCFSLLYSNIPWFKSVYHCF